MKIQDFGDQYRLGVGERITHDLQMAFRRAVDRSQAVKRFKTPSGMAGPRLLRKCR